MHEGDEITTIEGIGQPDNLHSMQAAFIEHDGYQCGYCTSGQIMSALALLKESCGPTNADVKELMSGNVCRCGAYPNIVAAINTFVSRHCRPTAIDFDTCANLRRRPNHRLVSVGVGRRGGLWVRTQCE
jgi:aerobic-type carbon monoxide dehydrogenase small subunit (CoxS/CutS family)